MSSLNQTLFDILHGFFLTRSLGTERLVIWGALYLPFVAAAVVLAVFFIEHDHRRRHWFVIELCSSIFIATLILAQTIQLLFQQVRPYIALHFVPAIAPVATYSFPSGHASALFALATTVRLHHKETGNVLFFLALVNGLARIAVGVHWPIDVLGGLVVGVVAALAAHAIVRFAQETHRQVKRKRVS